MKETQHANKLMPRNIIRCHGHHESNVLSLLHFRGQSKLNLGRLPNGSFKLNVPVQHKGKPEKSGHGTYNIFIKK